MRNWKKVKLEDVVSVLGDGLHGTPKYDDNGEYYFINGNNLLNGKIVIKDNTRRSNEAEYNKYKKNLNNRTILVSINGTLGNIALYNKEKCFLGKSVCYLNVVDEVDRLFIKYVLLDKNFQEYISNFAHGTTIKNVSLKTMREYPFLLPPLPEQKAIADILSSLDDKIDLLHRQNKTLEAMAETLFRKWFVLRQAQHPEADERWEKTKIGNVVETVLGGTPSTNVNEYWNGDIPWINSGEINKFRITEATKYITELGLAHSNTKLMPKGTTVLAITGATLGQVSLLEIDSCANQSVVGIIPNDKLPKEFIFLWIKNKIKEIILNETGGAQPHINKNDVNETEIIIPPKTILKEKNKIIEHFFNRITNNTFQIRTLEKLRDTLLPKLMSGEVRVNI